MGHARGKVPPRGKGERQLPVQEEAAAPMEEEEGVPPDLERESPRRPSKREATVD